VARGLNDTPKIVALGALAAAGAGLPPTPLFVVAALSMAVGGLVAGRRVTHTLGWRVAPLDARTGFAASAVTAVLVLAASTGAVPVSTTHVSGGAVVGAALGRTTITWSVVRQIALAWLVTLPVSGLIAAATWLSMAQ
jgi:PiT family inorganic phosphate transporter